MFKRKVETSDAREETNVYYCKTPPWKESEIPFAIKLFNTIFNKNYTIETYNELLRDFYTPSYQNLNLKPIIAQEYQY